MEKNSTRQMAKNKWQTVSWPFEICRLPFEILECEEQEARL
jgi:hypothetical protein